MVYNYSRYCLNKNLILLILMTYFAIGAETLKDDPQYQSYSFKLQLHVKDQRRRNIDGEYMMLYSYSLPANSDEYFATSGYVPFEKFDENVDFALLKDGVCTFQCTNINNAFVRMVLKEDLTQYKEYNKNRKKDFLQSIHKNGYDIRVLNDFIMIELDDTDLKSGENYLGGVYEMCVPYLNKAQSKRFAFNHQTLNKNEVSYFIFPNDIKKFGRMRPVIAKEQGEKGDPLSDLAIEAFGNSVKLTSMNVSLKFADINKDWFFAGYAPPKKSKLWNNEVELLYESESSLHNTILIYSERFDLYGKLAIKCRGGNFETYISFSTEKANRYLSQLDIDFGPKWLTKSLDELKDRNSTKYGLIKFTPIPEWNYPVE